MKIFITIAISTLSSLLALSWPVWAKDHSDLAKQAQNPISNLISLPFQNNTNFNAGPKKRTQNILNVQPVLPFSINDNWNVITRTILPKNRRVGSMRAVQNQRG